MNTDTQQIQIVSAVPPGSGRKPRSMEMRECAEAQATIKALSENTGKPVNAILANLRKLRWGQAPHANFGALAQARRVLNVKNGR